MKSDTHSVQRHIRRLVNLRNEEEARDTDLDERAKDTSTICVAQHNLAL